MDYSVVVPVLDERENIPPLVEEIRRALERIPGEAEIIFVDDGSGDGSAEVCEELGGIRVLRHGQRRGQSAALLTGVAAARGRWLLTLDGDGQNDPAALPDLVAALADHDAAVGVRTNRSDSAWRRFGSRLAYGARQLVLGDGIVDIGCALRAMPTELVRKLPPFDGLHRLLPALIVFAGLRVAQVPTAHRAREAGVSKYGNLRRGARGVFDLIGLAWLRRRILWDDVRASVRPDRSTP